MKNDIPKIPIIILSHPQMGENIGATARVMSNFGYNELRLIAPRDGWPNPKAFEMAANGSFVLKGAKQFPDIKSAISDINTLYGTASINRFIAKDVIQPSEIIKENGKTAFLFGCERTGLNNEELALCDKIIKIPTAKINPSLNLAQAVCIIAYEYQKHILNSEDSKPSPRANKKEIDHMTSYLESQLIKVNFFKSLKMKPIMMRNITSMFMGSNLTKQNVQTLYGIFKALKGK